MKKNFMNLGFYFFIKFCAEKKMNFKKNVKEKEFGLETAKKDFDN
jgi:hypothetical protein